MIVDIAERIHGNRTFKVALLSFQKDAIPVPLDERELITNNPIEAIRRWERWRNEYPGATVLLSSYKIVPQ